jgi:hypothetical protein
VCQRAALLGTPSMPASKVVPPNIALSRELIGHPLALRRVLTQTRPTNSAACVSLVLFRQTSTIWRFSDGELTRSPRWCRPAPRRPSW